MDKTQRRKKFIKEVIMDWRQDIKDPQLGELYFDIATLTMWEYKSLGDYPPEWINVSAFLDEYEG